MKKKIRLFFDGLILPVIVYISILLVFTLIYELFIEKIYQMNTLLIQSCASVFIIIFFIFMYKAYSKKYELENPKLNKKVLFYMIPLGISLCVCFNLLLIMIFKNIDNQVSKEAEELLENYPIIVVIIAIAIFPPIIEELLFRGFSYYVFKVFFGDIVSIIVTSIFFALSHGNIPQGIYAMIAGLIIGYYRFKLKNIIYPLILHLIMNLSGIFFGGVLFLIIDIKERIFVIFIMSVIAIISIYRINNIINLEEK